MTPPYHALPQLSEYHVPVFARAPVSDHTRDLAAQFDRAYTYLTRLFDIQLDVGLALLSPDEWPHYTESPFYGVSIYDYPHRTVVSGSEQTHFWQPLVARLQTEAPELLVQLESVYSTPEGRLDLTPNVELWMIHDLGHACHLHGDYWFPRKWLMELFASLCLYTYVAEQAPELLPVAETFFLVLRALPEHLIDYHRLTDFEAQYVALPLVDYLWFSGHLMELARDLYIQCGSAVLLRFWQMFVLERIDDLPDAELWPRLWAVDPEITALLIGF